MPAPSVPLTSTAKSARSCRNTATPATGPTRRRGRPISLDRKEDAFRDREGTAAIVPGKAEESELIRRIAAVEPDQVMPPPKFPKRLDPGRSTSWLVGSLRGRSGTAHWWSCCPRACRPHP